MIVTYFNSVYDDKPIHLKAESVLKRFGEKGNHYETLQKIENSKDKKERDELKLSLPVICFNGKFEKRNKESLIEGSGLMVLDFDSGGEDVLREARGRLQKWNCTYACFSSPSGHGRFKALIRIPKVKSDNEFKQFFAYFEREFKVDASGKDVSRAAFITHDPAVYINPNAKEFTRDMLNKYATRPAKNTNTKLLDQIAGWMANAPSGQRQHTACKVGFYAGGLCATGTLNEVETLPRLLAAAEVRGGEVEQSKRAIRESFEKGKNEPILDLAEIERRVGESMGKKINPKDFLVDDDDMDSEIEDFYEDRRIFGRSLGIEHFDHFWRYRDNSFYFIISGKGQGKTTTVLFLLLLDAIRNNKRYIICLFENTASSGRNMLISFYLDKFAKQVYQKNRTVYEDAKKMIKKHFTFIDPHKSVHVLTFDEVLSLAKNINEESKHDGLFIDPINAVPLPTGVSNEYRHHVDCGIKAKKFATKTMSLYLTGHPNSAKQREGNAPKDVDAEGGGTYPNKADITATLFRDVYGEDEAKYITDLRVTKVRDKELYGGDENLDNFPIRLIFDRKGYGFVMSCPYPNTAGYAPQKKIKVV